MLRYYLDYFYLYAISTTLTPAFYQRLLERSVHNPIFIYPIKKEGGYMVFLSQAQQKSILITTVDEFK